MSRNELDLQAEAANPRRAWLPPQPEWARGGDAGRAGGPPAKRARHDAPPHGQEYHGSDARGMPPAEAPLANGGNGRAAFEAWDEGIQNDGVPQGWRECPAMGAPLKVEGLLLVPVKVPLDERYDAAISPHQRFSPGDLIAMVAERTRGKTLHLVIDLTNTSRYYDAEWLYHCNINYVKISCRGRGAWPDPLSVNAFMWALLQLKTSVGGTAEFPAVVAVHCTHGFNRTGFMVVSSLVRLAGLTVDAALREFAKARPPGIYKPDYTAALFKYYHEKRPVQYATPRTPEWKGPGSPRAEAEPAMAGEAAGPMHHDDDVGEEIDPVEAAQVQEVIMQWLHPRYEPNMRPYFPGSQPVSLANTNLHLLHKRRYWVTWKADGTRFMLLICRWGSYLIDRSFKVRRVQMRFPTRISSRGGQQKRLVGPSHDRTLLDGEMVVDTDPTSGQQKRRFLAYDIMALQGELLSGRPFKERFELIDKEVVAPRELEKGYIARGKYTLPYDYADEPFSVRRKDFWPLPAARKVLDRMIPTLCHEADGLILQGYEDPYVPLTCEQLLKWKFPHMNSVDFKLSVRRGGGLALSLLDTRAQRRGVQMGSLPLAELPDARVFFPEGESPETYLNGIIECTYDWDRTGWMFMRERKDKATPNAWSVYEKVMRSIEDNITAEVLLGEADVAVQNEVYQRDWQHIQQQPPPQLPSDVPRHGGDTPGPEHQMPPETSRHREVEAEAGGHPSREGLRGGSGAAASSGQHVNVDGDGGGILYSPTSGTHGFVRGGGGASADTAYAPAPLSRGHSGGVNAGRVEGGGDGGGA